MTVLSLETAEEGRSAGGPSASAILASDVDISGDERNSPIFKFLSIKSKAEHLLPTKKKILRQWQRGVFIGAKRSAGSAVRELPHAALN
jgi:hypothetical protein